MSIAEQAVRISHQIDDFPFETYAFHQCWWEFLASKFDIPVKHGDLLIYRKPALKGLVKMREARIAGWNSAWAQDLTAARVDALEELAHTSQWDYFRMTWSESRAALQAFEQLEEKGYLYVQKPAPAQYSIDLSAGFEGYLQGLSHNSRKSLEKKTRQGQALNSQLVFCTEESEIDSFFAELFLHHMAYWNAKADGSYFYNIEERNFIVNWAKALHHSGQLVLDRLLMGEETVSLSMGIRTGNSFYWLLTINTELRHDYAPGIIGLYLRLKQMAEQGITQFHMGSGDHFFKIQSANYQTPRHELIAFNPQSFKGRAYFKWMRYQQTKNKGE